MAGISKMAGTFLFASLLLCAGSVHAQVIVTYSSIVFSVVVDRGELRETMRSEHRARVERAMANRPERVQRNFDQPDPNQRNEDAARVQREAEIAERRARWQRMSPDERQQLRRDINQAGREFYQAPPPPPPRRDGP